MIALASIDRPEHTYPPDTAGRVMTTSIPVVHASDTLAEVYDFFARSASTFETVNYIYVVDHKGTLIGAFSLRELFRADKSIVVRTLIAGQEVVHARVHTDQERVVFLALKHNLKTIPIVDKNDILLGAVASDVILRILDKEAIEDLLRFGGMSRRAFDNVENLTLLQSLTHRLPWLIVGLAGGIAAAAVIAQFEAIVSQHLIIAAFIPLVVYIADAVGTQMEAFIIRDLAVNPTLLFRGYFWRQFRIVALMGLILAALVYVMSFGIYGNMQVSAVLSISLLCAVVSSVFVGLVVPYLFSSMKFDPANASGPIATILQDLISVSVYFFIASLLL